MLLPAAAGLEMAVAAAAATFGPGAHAIEDLVLREAMIFADGARIAQTIVEPAVEGAARFQIQSKLEHGEEWTLHYEGRLRSAASASPSEPVEPFSEIAARFGEVVLVDDLYELLERQGVAFGPGFRVLRDVKRRAGEASSSIALTEHSGSDRRYAIHPILLDGCLQTVLAALFPDADPDALYLPIGMRRFRAFSSLATEGRAHAVLERGTRPGAPVLRANVSLHGPDDELVATFEGMEFQRVGKNTLLHQARGGASEWLYERVWEPAPLSPPRSGEIRAGWSWRTAAASVRRSSRRWRRAATHASFEPPRMRRAERMRRPREPRGENGARNAATFPASSICAGPIADPTLRPCKPLSAARSLSSKR